MSVRRADVLILAIAACFALAAPAHAIDEYRLDDGLKESSWGVSGGSGDVSFAWLNRFTVESGKEVVTGLRVAFGGSGSHNNVANGTAVTFYLWDDFNQDGDPGDAIVLASWSGVVANTGSNALTTYAMPSPQTLQAGRIFFAGAIIDDLPNVPFPNHVRVGALDEDGNDSVPGHPPHLHSFVAASNQGIPVDPHDLDGAIVAVAPVSAAFPLPTCQNCSGDGSWLIRVNAHDPNGTPRLSASPDSLDFGHERVFGLGAQQATTLASTGTTTVDVTAIGAVGVPFFRNTFATGACPTPPFPLIPGATCTLDYSFGPQTDGLHTTTIAITSNAAPPPPAPILLSGIGVHVVLDTLPAVVDFGTVEPGGAATATLQVANASNGTATGFPVEVFGLQAALPFPFGIAPGSCGAFPFSVAYLGTCSLEFSFTPVSTGDSSFVTELTSNASILPLPFELRGKAMLIGIFSDGFEAP